MPWWSWLVIWACLVLALLAVLVLSGWRLFRKAMAVFHELGALAEKAELLDQLAADSDEQQAKIAILQDLADVQARRRFVRDRAADRRDARRASRVERGLALVRFDANSKRWFEAR